ncbi:uncharacterized protein LOC110597888 [Ictidomys tridecemlineatus]
MRDTDEITTMSIQYLPCAKEMAQPRVWVCSSPGVREAGSTRPGRGHNTEGKRRLAASTETGVPKTVRRRGRGRRRRIGGWVSESQCGGRGDFSQPHRSTRPTKALGTARCLAHHCLLSILEQTPGRPMKPAGLPDPGYFSSRPVTAASHRRQSLGRLISPLPTVFPSPQTHLPRPRGSQHLLLLLGLPDWLSRDVAVNQPIPAPSRDQADQLTVCSGSEAGSGSRGRKVWLPPPAPAATFPRRCAHARESVMGVCFRQALALCLHCSVLGSTFVCKRHALGSYPRCHIAFSHHVSLVSSDLQDAPGSYCISVPILESAIFPRSPRMVFKTKISVLSMLIATGESLNLAFVRAGKYCYHHVFFFKFFIYNSVIGSL